LCVPAGALPRNPVTYGVPTDAGVAELVDATDLKSVGASRAGSTPAPGTKPNGPVREIGASQVGVSVTSFSCREFSRSKFLGRSAESTFGPPSTGCTSAKSLIH
jgi:hypothetical protein